MNVIKINIHVKDHKHNLDYSYTKLALNLDAAVKFLEKEFSTLTDTTSQFFEQFPYIDMFGDAPIKVYEHTKSRVDEDGDFDYPTEYNIQLTSEEIIE